MGADCIRAVRIRSVTVDDAHKAGVGSMILFLSGFLAGVIVGGIFMFGVW